jgi:KUP system potassium uptake protein
MLVWFLAIAMMGITGIVRHPSVFAALNPVYGLSYLFSHGATGFLVLGAVFLCVNRTSTASMRMPSFGVRI